MISHKPHCVSDIRRVCDKGQGATLSFLPGQVLERGTKYPGQVRETVTGRPTDYPAQSAPQSPGTWYRVLLLFVLINSKFGLSCHLKFKHSVSGSFSADLS